MGFIAELARCTVSAMHHRSPPKSTIEDIPRPVLPEETPNAYKSPVPPVVVECWIGMVAHMDREHLDRFTHST
jgi:hypothetical protein